MADCKNHEIKSPDKTTSRSSSSSSSFFSRSITLKPEITDKPLLYNLYNTPALNRSSSSSSSIKTLYSYSSPLGSMLSASNALRGKVKKLCSIFETPKPPTKLLLIAPPDRPSSDLIVSRNIPSAVPDFPFRLPGTEDRVVIYFTSLRGIRKTFHDCHSVRMIFRGFRVNLDERDISMDATYKKELQKVLGENRVSLPQVFIKGKYIGGADVIRQLLEAGELAWLIKGLPLGPPKPCDACDDVRFVPCTNCNGSRKVFDEDDADGQPKRCPECNENGLVRCPLCCS